MFSILKGKKSQTKLILNFGINYDPRLWLFSITRLLAAPFPVFAPALPSAPRAIGPVPASTAPPSVSTILTKSPVPPRTSLAMSYNVFLSPPFVFFFPPFMFDNLPFIIENPMVFFVSFVFIPLYSILAVFSMVFVLPYSVILFAFVLLDFILHTWLSRFSNWEKKSGWWRG